MHHQGFFFEDHREGRESPTWISFIGRVMAPSDGLRKFTTFWFCGYIAIQIWYTRTRHKVDIGLKGQDIRSARRRQKAASSVACAVPTPIPDPDTPARNRGSATSPPLSSPTRHHEKYTTQSSTPQLPLWSSKRSWVILLLDTKCWSFLMDTI